MTVPFLMNCTSGPRNLIFLNKLDFLGALDCLLEELDSSPSCLEALRLTSRGTA
ncbi:hypothetical protein ANAPH2_00407 [Anaplasma phagocytophilum]|nr:hypothetical protein ANAPH2_00407 [Anaplasma phagocytophilum]